MNNNTSPLFDLFISYAEADHPWVEGYLLDALKQADVRYHTKADFPLGVPLLTAFERAIKQSRRTLLILSQGYLADDFTQFTDLLAQTYGLKTETWPVIPLLLHPVSLPSRLSILTKVDATSPEDWPSAVERLCTELHRQVPTPNPKPPCPYPGMVPFTQADAEKFFGRDLERDELCRRLRHQNYLFVIGSSGSGKSSLVSAGLVPELHRQRPGWWRVKVMHPGPTPLAALTQILGGSPQHDATYEERVTAYEKLVTATLAQIPGTQQLLIIIDQFEELFTQSLKPDQNAFIAAIKALRQVTNCSLIITMRADFYEDLMMSDLWPIELSQRLEIAPLQGNALREAISKPAKKLGVYLEAELLDCLLTDAAGEPGVLPLVQETMVLLWEWMERRVLSRDAYKRLGDKIGDKERSGLAVAIATKADATLAALPSTQEKIARRIFLRLIQFGEGRSDTRREQPVSTLLTIQDNPPEIFEKTLAHLVENRLLTLTSKENAPDRKVSIAHEVLIDGWPMLKQWINEQQEKELFRRHLEAKAAEWGERVHKKQGGGLLDEFELRETQQWLEGLDAADSGYSNGLLDLVETSKQAIKPNWDWRGTIALLFGISGIIASVAWVVFFLETTEVPAAARPAAWWGAALLAGLVGLAFISLRRADRYFLRRLSLAVTNHRFPIIGVVLCVLAATILWVGDGVQRLETERTCRDLGFRRGESTAMIAVVNMTNDAVAGNFFVTTLEQAAAQDITAKLVTVEEAERCRSFILTELRLDQSEASSRGESSLVLQVVDTSSREIVGTESVFGSDVCGLFSKLAYRIADVLGFARVKISDSPSAIGPSTCDAVNANDRGYNFLKEGRYPEAEQELSLALQIFPQYPMALSNLGRVYYETGRYTKGITSIREAIRLSDRPFIPFLLNLAKACYRTGDYPCAEQANTQVLHLEPGNTDALNNMAVVYRVWGKYDQAQQMLDKFEAIIMLTQPQNRNQDDWYTLLKNKGILLFEMGKLQEATEILAQASTKGEWFEEEIIYYQAMIAFHQGRIEDTCTYLRLRAQLMPSTLFGADARSADTSRLANTLACQ